MPLPLLTETRRALTVLAQAVQFVGKQAGDPELYGPQERHWWRYPGETELQVIAVKAVRAASGLNACIPLLHEGFSVETAVILRTVDDALDQITFLVEAYQSGNPTSAQRAFVRDFFSETIESEESMLKGVSRPDRAKRKDVRAAQARYLQPENPDRVRKTTSAIDHTLDGYVHAGYPHSMELYDQNKLEFMLEGSRHSPYPQMMQVQHAFYVSRALSILGDVSNRLGNTALLERLKAARDRFESSSEYPK